MPRWEIMTTPARPEGPLTGVYPDDDLRFRLRAFSDMLLRAEAAAREAQAQPDKAVASGRRNGQQAIVTEALRHLAERRAR
jgi:hypothetical protein